ncbi:MAG TPA: dihydrofolate reductase family protein [Thermomicrobiales bacterium]|jgi:dihydrofolate reductase|nr:dihydrofolate reductase family protein [Thermomicrobiales bacterium]
MRRLISSTFLSLDGVMQAPGGKGEDPDGGFDLEGWSVTYWDERMGEIMGAAMAEPFDLLLGRRTYDIFAAHWPRVSEEEGGGPINRATKYVVSRSLRQEDTDWATTVVLGGSDAVVAIRELKAGEGPEIQVHGSANLLQTLNSAGLIDEYRIWTFPVVLGKGKRLFELGVTPAGLQLASHEVSTTGVTIATFTPAGPVPMGTFALDADAD